MKTIEIQVPQYNPQSGIVCQWDAGYAIQTEIQDGALVISANQAGLISLARHLLVLAQDAVPAGAHIHLDAYNSLEAGSAELILQRGT